MIDQVNHPPHYTAGKYEAIDVLEDSVQHAPNPIFAGLQWNSMKYLLRLWTKSDPLKDAKKSRWYLDRLIKKLEEESNLPV